MSGNKEKQKGDWLLFALLRAGAFLCLAGWTWVHYYWEGPLSVLVWHDWTYDLAKTMGVGWDDFVGTGANDGVIQKWMSRIFWLFLVCSTACFTAGVFQRYRWVDRASCSMLVLGSVLIVLVSFAKYVRSEYQLPMFIEHSGQILIPLVLLCALLIGVRHRGTRAIAVIGVVMTFAGHGCYAAGIWPTPPHFYGMTTLVFGWEHETTVRFLYCMGIMDFMVCIGLLTPLKRFCALYAVAWGLATAVARPYAGMSWDLNYWGADQYLHEAVLRAPHFLLPLYLFFVWRRDVILHESKT